MRARARTLVGLRSAADASLEVAPQQRHAPTGSRWQRVLHVLRRDGLAYLGTYALIAHVNLALMFGAAWALYLRTHGVCPIELRPGALRAVAIIRAFYSPYLWQPQFAVFFGGLCLSVGSLTRPVRAGMAAGVLPLTRRLLRLYQERFGCPRALAYALTFLTGFFFSNATFAPAVLVACAILSVPVYGP